jgi:ubiquinone/menaquinone biosynthesis C-methylase UbiE
MANEAIMNELSEAEKQLLVIIFEVRQRERPADKASLEESGKKYFTDELVDWSEAYSGLIEKGFTTFENDIYALTDQGLTIGRYIRDKYMREGFDETLLKAETSPTYGKFCEMLYGKNLRQFNMMNMSQIGKLLEVLNLGPASRVLDMGCGIGILDEYISDLTGAHITGIDFASQAMDRANLRTEPKKERLTYLDMDMNSLDFPPRSFDTVIAIDTLYFVFDLEVIIAEMKSVLTTDGQMGFYYTQMVRPKEPEDMLKAKNTKLAQVLKKLDLKFKTWDFTQDEYAHWRDSKQIAEKLKSEFEAEGNIDMYKGRIREADNLLEYVNDKRITRYLYHVKL